MEASGGNPVCGMGRWGMCASLNWCGEGDGNSWMGRAAQEMLRSLPSTSRHRARTPSEHEGLLALDIPTQEICLLSAETHQKEFSWYSPFCSDFL